MTALAARSHAAGSSATTFFSGFSKIAAADQRSHATVYNYWLSVRGRSKIPSIRDLDPIELSSLGANSLLLALLDGGQDAEINFLGEALAGELADADMERIADAPSPSIFSCVAEHLPQVLSTGNPLAFEREFSAAGDAVICWGTLLPFSSTGTWSDYVFGVITFEKRACDVESPAPESELFPETVERSIRPINPPEPEIDSTVQPPSRATFNIDESAWQRMEFDGGFEDFISENLGTRAPEHFEPNPAVTSGVSEEGDEESGGERDSPLQATHDSYLEALGPTRQHSQLPDGDAGTKKAEPEPLGLDVSAVVDPLQASLTHARAKAEAAAEANVRSRAALYSALSAAYDFALEAQANPQAYNQVLQEAGLAAQARAPMTPIVKLVFGLDYGKARVTEFAAVLSWARRRNLAAGSLADRLQSEGGIKVLIEAERALRRVDEERPDRDDFAKLRSAAPLASLTIGVPNSDEFVLLVARREANGEYSVLSAVADERLLRRAARKMK